ncbi:MAG TPA: class I SAM-dependent methyltransferase [Haliangiales bacterium]|nr:class I SAM-dependent methyltransferase [Haliangiales bacterium]
MNEIHTHWFDPVTLYRDGYPDEITSALRVSPLLRDVVREETAALAPELVLEIGPGDMPACAGLAKVVFLDVAQVFLRSLDGLRVRADLMHAPFEPGTFDVVVVSDVLTHVRPARRRDAVAAMAALGRHLVLFNPEMGTETVAGSKVVSHPIPEILRGLGFTVTVREFMAFAQAGHRMMLFTARR